MESEPYKINYILRQLGNSLGNSTSPILFRANSKFIEGGRFQMAVGESVPVKSFNPKKPTKAMMRIATAFERVFHTYPQKAIRPKAELKKAMIDELHPEKAEIIQAIEVQQERKERMPIDEFIKRAIDEKWKTKNSQRKMIEPTAGTLKNWKSLYNNIQWFHRDKKFSLEFEFINSDWLEHFYDWLQQPHTIWHNAKKKQSEGLNDATRWKYIKDLKKFLRIAQIRYRYPVPPDFLEFSVKTGFDQSDKMPLYLSESELKQIISIDLNNLPGLLKTRDWLIIGCLTGQRFSDWHKLKPENVIFENGLESIHLNQTKTGSKVKVLINPTIRQIWAKYPNGMPSPGAEQVMNRNLKTLCQKAGIDQVFNISIDGQKVLKYEKISTHIGRRSFCTNAYLQGLPIVEIMSVSGHKSETEFMRYIRLSDDDKLKRMSEHPFFTKAL